MRDEMNQAKVVLERACPLMELLLISSFEQRLSTGCFSVLRNIYEKLNTMELKFSTQKGQNLISSSDTKYTDIESRIEELRLPFNHLRLEHEQKVKEGKFQKILGQESPQENPLSVDSESDEMNSPIDELIELSCGREYYSLFDSRKREIVLEFQKYLQILVNSDTFARQIILENSRLLVHSILVLILTNF
jgi:hypothetical protein